MDRSITDSSGHLLTMTDALNETTTYAYNATTGLLTGVTEALNHTSSSAYDGDRRLTAMTDALNNVTSYSYDASGNRTGVTTPPVTGFPAGRTTTTSYTNGTSVAAADGGFAPPGLPWQVTTPGGAVTTTVLPRRRLPPGSRCRSAAPTGSERSTPVSVRSLARRTSPALRSSARSPRS